jgi:hypothetical protein
MMLSLRGDPRKVEAYAAAHPDAMREIIESGKGHGLIAHRFYGSEDGQIMVIDEWPDEASFQAFFEENGPRIGPMMQASDVTSEPHPTFWRELETNDAVG